MQSKTLPKGHDPDEDKTGSNLFKKLHSLAVLTTHMMTWLALGFLWFITVGGWTQMTDTDWNWMNTAWLVFIVGSTAVIIYLEIKHLV